MAGRVDYLEDAVHLDAQILRLLPLPVGGFRDLALGFQLLGDQLPGDHDEVNWNKFQDSPAYKLTSEDQQKCLDTAHKNGNGQDGLVGYEILDCGLNEGYD